MHRPQGFSQFCKVSMNHLTIYYDGHCSLCCRIRNWLSTEPQIVQLRFIDRWSDATQSPFAGQITQFAGDDLVAVADDGRVGWVDGSDRSRNLVPRGTRRIPSPRSIRLEVIAARVT